MKNFLNSGQDDLLSDMIVQTNDPSFNYNKALEECNEFCEVILKLQTKHIENTRRPTEEDAIGEYGDMLYRGMYALRTLFPHMTTDQLSVRVNEHIDMKLAKLSNYFKEGKYGKGL